VRQRWRHRWGVMGHTLLAFKIAVIVDFQCCYLEVIRMPIWNYEKI